MLSYMYGFQIVFLPKYSPEFNSCKLIFGNIKQYLREYGKNTNFYIDIIIAIAQILKLVVLKYYHHCTQQIYEK